MSSTGREEDSIWVSFEEVRNESRKGLRVKCKRCSHEMEVHVKRMKVHLEHCTKNEDAAAGLSGTTVNAQTPPQQIPPQQPQVQPNQPQPTMRMLGTHGVIGPKVAIVRPQPRNVLAQNQQGLLPQQPGVMQPTSVGLMSQGPPQATVMQAQQNPGLQQPPPQAQGSRERQTIWSGILEWIVKRTPGGSQKLTRHIPCQVSASFKVGGVPELKADSWPQKLIMQLMPKQLIGNVGGAYFRNSKSVLFHTQACDTLESLTKFLSSGFAGCVHFTGSPQCDIKVLILLYISEIRAYLGFIPNDQVAFVDRLREVIQHQKSTHALNRQEGQAPQGGPGGALGGPQVPPTSQGPIGAMLQQPPQQQQPLGATLGVGQGNDPMLSTSIAGEPQQSQQGSNQGATGVPGVTPAPTTTGAVRGFPPAYGGRGTWCGAMMPPVQRPPNYSSQPGSALIEQLTRPPTAIGPQFTNAAGLSGTTLNAQTPPQQIPPQQPQVQPNQPQPTMRMLGTHGVIGPKVAIVRPQPRNVLAQDQQDAAAGLSGTTLNAQTPPQQIPPQQPQVQPNQPQPTMRMLGTPGVIGPTVAIVQPQPPNVLAQNQQGLLPQQPGVMQPTSVGLMSQGPPQATVMQAQQNPGLQQPPSQAQGSRERQTIWSGILEWIEKKTPGDSQKLTRHVPCQVSASFKVGGVPELKAYSWPQKLIMQLMPKQLIGNVGGAYFRNSKSVLFHPQACDTLESLTTSLSSGFAGCVHFTGSPQCDIKVLILLYISEIRAYLGFIPNDQVAFVDRLREVIQHQNSTHALNRQEGQAPQGGQQGPGGALGGPQVPPTSQGPIGAMLQQPPQQQQPLGATLRVGQGNAPMLSTSIAGEPQQSQQGSNQQEQQKQWRAIQQLQQQQAQQQKIQQQQQVRGLAPQQQPGAPQQRMMRPPISNNQLRHLLQGPQPQYRMAMGQQQMVRGGIPQAQGQQMNPQQQQFEDVSSYDFLN